MEDQAFSYECVPKKNFFSFLNQNTVYVVGTQRNHLNEFILSTQNIC